MKTTVSETAYGELLARSARALEQDAALRKWFGRWRRRTDEGQRRGLARILSDPKSQEYSDYIAHPLRFA